MRTRFLLGNTLRCWGLSQSFANWRLTVSSTYVVRMRQFFAKIPRMDEILTGYWMAGQVRTMGSSVIYKNKLSMEGIILGRTLIIPCDIYGIHA